MTNAELPGSAVERNPVVFAKDGQAFAESRDIAAFFQKNHKDVLRAIRNLIEKEPELGRRNFSSFKTKDLTGESTSHYEMDRDGFMLLAMGFTGAEALKWKLRYIEAFNAMEAQLRDPMTSALAALSDPKAMRGLLLTYSEKVLTLESHVAELQPKAEALGRIAESEGSFCITDAAKTLQIPPKSLFSFLRSHRWVYTRAGSASEVAYQDKLASGLLEHKTTTVHRSDGSERVVTQVRVTPRGLARLAQEFPPLLTQVA